MLTAQAQSALNTLATAVEEQHELFDAYRARWRSDGRLTPPGLSKELCTAADELSKELLTLAQPEGQVESLGALFAQPVGEVLLAWCSASTWRRDIELSPILTVAKDAGVPEWVIPIARQRVVEGPIRDALVCVPLIGGGAELTLPSYTEARARLQILLWEAGASALEVPELARWIWGSHDTFVEVIEAPAHGALRDRAVVARCLEITACGMPHDIDPELMGRTLKMLQPLLFHPEPLVWIHAARALGRLTGPMEQLVGTLLDWVQGDSPIIRQRAITAFASVPAHRLGFLAPHLAAIIKSPDNDPFVLAAVAAATPYLFFERRDLWDRLAPKILSGAGGAVAARALAKGLATLRRRGVRDAAIEDNMRLLRELARRARPSSLVESRRWIEVTAVTDVIDGAERDPLDLELGIENLVRVAAQYDDEEADARAARFAGSLATTFQEALRITLGTGSVRHRAAAKNALEGCARAFSLRLWSPMLATRPGGTPVEEPDLEETWKIISRSPAELLDVVKERQQVEGASLDTTVPLEVLAVRLGGYALDACSEDSELGPGRGPSAHDTCLWLRKIEGLLDGSREFPPSLSEALSSLFWRLVDTTQGTALGEVDDVRWLGPFAAWWALVIDRPTVLLQLATALPILSLDALRQCCQDATELRAALETGEPDGQWGESVAVAFASLHAQDTELAQAVLLLADSLEAFGAAGGRKPELDAMCLDLVLAAERLQRALANPVAGLHPVGESDDAAEIAKHDTENAPRISALVARAIRARELSMLDVWFASLGPIASALLENAVRGAIRRTPPPPPTQKKPQIESIEGYELVKQLGEGGIGKVWLVRKPGADRLFVLKIPKAEALANATETEREGILASFIEEARALAALYHPNVANIIDRGVSSNVPFMVLEYLIGADLSQYAEAQRMSLFELRQVVLETCAGLAALHSANLVHRDIKPANIWLRLPLAGGEKFDPQKHRNPAHTPPLAAVVIDFGMVRSTRVSAESAGRFVAGTPGYIAPEQVLDPIELDVRADMYALAATICNVTTGRSFFDDIPNPRDRIIAHMRRDPFEDAERLRSFPAGIAKLLRAAAARAPEDRPGPMEFARAFAAAL